MGVDVWRVSFLMWDIFICRDYDDDVDVYYSCDDNSDDNVNVEESGGDFEDLLNILGFFIMISNVVR